MELVQLLGYSNYADYVLKKRMAETEESVYQLLNQLLEAYSPTAHQEVKEVEELAHRLEGNDFH